MKIKIISTWNNQLSGAFTSALDLYYNLKKYIDVEFCLYTEKPSICIKHLFNNNNRDILNNLHTTNKFTADLIICSSNIIYKDITLNSDNLFIIDSLDMIRNDYDLPDLNYDNIKIFSNPANIVDKISYDQIEYYHKFSKYRLENLPKYYQTNLKHFKKELFFNEIYNYNRTFKDHLKINRTQFKSIEKHIYKHLKMDATYLKSLGKYIYKYLRFNNTHFENIGKRIFEHLYFNKIVNYNYTGMNIPDGLFYYLKLFGIDATKNYYPLQITSDEIKEKLIMNEDDELLKEIKYL